MKRCSKCRRWLPWSAFHRNLHSDDGHQSWCRRCVSNNNRRYYMTNRAARLAYGRQYRDARNTGA